MRELFVEIFRIIPKPRLGEQVHSSFGSLRSMDSLNLNVKLKNQLD